MTDTMRSIAAGCPGYVVDRKAVRAILEFGSPPNRRAVIQGKRHCSRVDLIVCSLAPVLPSCFIAFALIMSRPRPAGTWQPALMITVGLWIFLSAVLFGSMMLYVKRSRSVGEVLSQESDGRIRLPLQGASIDASDVLHVCLVSGGLFVTDTSRHTPTRVEQLRLCVRHRDDRAEPAGSHHSHHVVVTCIGSLTRMKPIARRLAAELGVTCACVRIQRAEYPTGDAARALFGPSVDGLVG